MDPWFPPTVTVFRRRRRRVMTVTALFVVALAGLEKEVAAAFGLSGAQEMLGFGTVFALWGLVTWTSWRCPECRGFPGHHWRPRFCDRCGTQLLPVPHSHPLGRTVVPGSAADRNARAAWQEEQEKWERNISEVHAVRYGLLLMALAALVYVFGIVLGVAGDGTPDSDLGRRFGPDGPRWAGIGLGLVAALFFPVVVRACRREFEDAWSAPERVERGLSAFLGLAAATMILCGAGGLLYAVSPIDTNNLGWELRLAPIDNARELAAGSALYAGAGLLLLGHSVRRWRRAVREADRVRRPDVL